VLNRKYGIQAHCTNTKIKTKKLERRRNQYGKS